MTRIRCRLIGASTRVKQTDRQMHSPKMGTLITERNRRPLHVPKRLPFNGLVTSTRAEALKEAGCHARGGASGIADNPESH